MIKNVNPTDLKIQNLITDLTELNGKLYPKESTFQDSPRQMLEDKTYLVGYFFDNEPIGIGGLKPYDQFFELKRMYVISEYQGRGIAQKILKYLENYSICQGVRVIKLETGILQKTAIEFYKKNGYKECRAFGDYLSSEFNLFFEKKLEL